MSNRVVGVDFLAQVEYALIENDTIQAELILNYLMKEKPRSRIAKISMLRLLSIKNQTILKTDEYWGNEELSMFFKLMQSNQVWVEKREMFLNHISDNTFVNDQKIMESFDKLNEILIACQYSIDPVLNKEMEFLQQLILEGLGFYQSTLKPKLTSGTNRYFALELICFLQKETISRLFWAEFLKKDFLDNPFYFEYQKCINLLELHNIKASFFAKQFSLNPTQSTQHQLADTYDIIIFIEGQIFQKGLFNTQRKEYVRNRFNLQEDAIIFYFDQYQITKNRKWMEKILLTMENIKSSILETNRMYYDSSDLLKDLCRKVITEIEKVGNPSVLLKKNNSILDYIEKQIDVSYYYKCFYKIHKHSKEEINKVELPNLKNICKKTKSEHLAILNYFDSENYIFVLLIEKENEILNIIPKSNSDSLNIALQYLKKTFSNPAIALEATKASIFQFNEASALVYRSILKPLFEKGKPDHLVVIPDGIFHYIPLEALVVDSTNFSDQRISYLLHSTVVRYYPSLKLFSKYESGDEKIISINQLAISAPTYEYLESIEKGKSKFPRLNGAKLEIDKVKKIFPFKIKNHNSFDFKDVKIMEAPNQLLHFAMHASSEYNQNQGPVLIYSNKDKDALFLHDIALLSKVSPVVLLSACETGYGKYTAGEGLKSLGQQFLQIGAKCSIYNLNKAADDTSSELVIGFYKELKLKKESHKALQKVKIDFLKKADPFLAHPYFWSCLISSGQPFKIN